MLYSEDISAEINSEEDEKPVMVPDEMMCMTYVCNVFKDLTGQTRNETHFIRKTLEFKLFN